MRKQILLILILCFSTWIIRAERIDIATARQVAQSVAQQENATGGLRSTANLSLVYAAAPGKNGSALRSGTVDGAADYFVFNFPGNKGFAIVSGEDRVRPILGYSHKGSFDPDNLPDNLRDMLAFYQEQITWAINQDIETTPEISAEWNRYMSGTMPQTRARTISTAEWSQGEPFNLQTPMVNGEHTLTGCVATAMGIIMKHHNYPAKAVNPPAQNTYEVNGYTTTATITYDAYDWNNMLNSYNTSYSDTEANAVATLLYHCGANIKMNYGLSESGANTIRVAKALRDVFGYSPEIRFLPKESYRWEEWKQMLRNELDAGYPVIYDGRGNGGHAFVCDGYKENDLFSINWGWGGYQNGFYVLSVLNGYNEDQCMILNIRPQTSGETYYMRPYLLSAEYSGNGKNINVSFGLRYYALDDHNFYIELGVVDQNNNIIHPPKDPQSWNLTAYLGGYRSWSNITRSTTLSTDLSDGQRVTLLCSPDGTNWEVMRGLDNVPLGIGNEQIGPDPDDPDDPEQPLNANIMWNQFDDTFLQISGLDATQDNYLNTNGISYQLINPTDNVILHYTITNYNQWNGHLAIYYGDYTIGDGGKGTPVTITNGSFDIRLSPKDMEEGYYVNYLKVYSDKAGELSYTIQVKSESASSPALEQTGKKMIFVKDLKGELDPNPIQGAVDEEIPFAVKFTDIDNALTGKALSLSIYIQEMTKDQVQLFDAAGNKIELIVSEYDKNYLYLENPVAVGTLTKNQSYSFKIKSNTVFSNNTAYINITPLVDGKNVPHSYIGSNIIIDPAGSTTNYTVRQELTNLSSDKASPATVSEGTQFELTLNTIGSYRLPETVTILKGTTPLTEGTDYTYDKKSGKIVIHKVTSNLVIQAAGIKPDEPAPNTYTVTLPSVEGATITAIGSTTVEEGSNFAFTVTVLEGYNADNMTVKANGTTLQPDATGRYTIENVRNNMEINVSGIAKETDPDEPDPDEPDPNTYTVTLPSVEGATITAIGATTVEEGSNFTFTVTVKEGYNADNITVKANGTTLQPDATGRYTIENVRNNMEITVSGIAKETDPDEPDPDEPDPNTYTVTLPVVEGATITAIGATTVEEGSNFAFTVTVKEGYNADNITVKANNITLLPDVSGHYTIEDIRNNMVVTVSGIVKEDDPTANESIETEALHVWSADRQLFIQTTTTETTHIVTLDGRLYKTLHLPAGKHTEKMPQGIYIIHIGKQSFKLKF